MLTFSKHLTKKHMNVRNKKLLGRWNLRELTSHSQLEVCRFFSIANHGIETLNLEGSGFCFLRNGGGAVFLWGGNGEGPVSLLDASKIGRQVELGVTKEKWPCMWFNLYGKGYKAIVFFFGHKFTNICCIIQPQI